MILIINCSSVSLAARVQVIFTVCKLAALAMIVITGFVRLAQGKYIFHDNIVHAVN